jgi:hypothetical protein
MAGTTPIAKATTQTQAQVSPYDPTTYTNTYTPAQATSELQSAAQTQDAQQNANLMAMLAAQGISPGSSAAQGAAGQLANQQAAALDPSLAQVQQGAAGLNQQAGLFNAQAANTAGLDLAGAQNQDWLAQLEAMLGLQQTGLSTAGSLAGSQANQQVPVSPSIWSQILGGLGEGASVAAPFLGA